MLAYPETGPIRNWSLTLHHARVSGHHPSGHFTRGEHCRPLLQDWSGRNLVVLRINRHRLCLLCFQEIFDSLL